MYRHDAHHHDEGRMHGWRRLVGSGLPPSRVELIGTARVRGQSPRPRTSVCALRAESGNLGGATRDLDFDKVCSPKKTPQGSA